MIFTSAERRLLSILVLLLSAGFVLSGLRSVGLVPPPAPPAPPVLEDEAPLRARDRSPFTGGYLDLNRADSLDLISLPGIGPALAGRILARRRRWGRYERVDDLDQVKGIGTKTLARLRGYLCTGVVASCNPDSCDSLDCTPEGGRRPSKPHE